MCGCLCLRASCGAYACVVLRLGGVPAERTSSISSGAAGAGGLTPALIASSRVMSAQRGMLGEALRAVVASPPRLGGRQTQNGSEEGRELSRVMHRHQWKIETTASRKIISGRKDASGGGRGQLRSDSTRLSRSIPIRSEHHPIGHLKEEVLIARVVRVHNRHHLC